MVNPEYILTPSFLGQSKKSLFGQLFGRGVLMRDITDKTEFGTNVSRAHQSTCSRSQRSRAGFRAARRCTVAAEFPWDIERLLRRCTKPEPLPMGGKILRNALTESEQRWLYALLLVMAVPDSGEVIGLRLTANPADMLRHNPDNRPQPLVTWVHPYTRERVMRASGRLPCSHGPSSSCMSSRRRAERMLSSIRCWRKCTQWGVAYSSIAMRT